MNPGEEIVSPRYKHFVALNSHSNLVYLLCSLLILLINGPVDTLEQDANVCGTVRTSGGDVIILKENETLPSHEFDKVHIMKLQRATFTPVEERQCIIKVCGFTTLTPPINHPDGCIGSGSDLMDCQVIKKSTVANMRYNDRFNTSSISCGCFKQDPRLLPCQSKCLDRKQLLDAGTSSSNWKDNECAILFREDDCRDCYFDAIRLQTGKEFKSDNSHHINTMIVREKCVVSHDVSGLRRICHFKNSSGIFTYTNQQSKDTHFTPKSAFQIDPEVLSCTCEEPDVTTISPVPSGGTDDGGKVPIQIALGIVSAGFIMALGATVGLLISRHRHLRSSIDTDPENNKKSEVIESNETEFTECSESLEFNHILTLPLNSTFETCREFFELGDRLGGGHFGDVALGKLKVAVKCVKRNNDADDEVLSLKSLQHEIKILSYLGQHENVVRFLGACMQNCENGEIYLLTEYCKNGCLKDYLKTIVKPHIMGKVRRRILNDLNVSDDGYHEPSADTGALEVTENTTHDLEALDPVMFRRFLQWAEDIANGMQYITLKKVVHVDLAARNILLTHNFIAKIGDFGLSKKIYVKEYVTAKKDSMPILWVAPESLTKNKYSSKSDIWAYGVTLWEIFTLGKDPYHEMDSMNEVLRAIIQGEGLSRAEFAPDDVHAKLLECWKENPDERPSFEDLREYFAAKQTPVQQQCEGAAPPPSPSQDENESSQM